MQSVPREWLDFLRQQFPKDSRIQLTEIGGNPRPISPGSTGKLDYIDDAGQFHVKWDNGCTLALVLGEDRFSVYLPEPQTFKLYMPLTADFYGRDEWGDMSATARTVQTPRLKKPVNRLALSPSRSLTSCLRLPVISFILLSAAMEITTFPK